MTFAGKEIAGRMGGRVDVTDAESVSVTDAESIPVKQASLIKRRCSTKAEVERRRAALHDTVKAMKPMTVRQVFYQATVRGVVEKTEAGYTKVQTDLTIMRRAGDLPYDWLADNTRWQRRPTTYNGVEEALQETAKFY